MEELSQISIETELSRRGIGPSDANYTKIIQYAGASNFLKAQCEAKTVVSVTDTTFSLLLSTLVSAVYIDHATEADKDRPHWDTFRPILFDGLPLFGTDGTGFWSTLPNDLVEVLCDDIESIGGEQRERLRFCWDAMLHSMYEQRSAVTLGANISDIGTRVLEAVCMADLLCSILIEDEKEYCVPFFVDWLSLQMSAGNLMDAVMDYKEDLKSGHRKLSLVERSTYLVTALGMSFKYLTHPMTTKADRASMLKKFNAGFGAIINSNFS